MDVCVCLCVFYINRLEYMQNSWDAICVAQTTHNWKSLWLYTLHIKHKVLYYLHTECVFLCWFSISINKQSYWCLQGSILWYNIDGGNNHIYSVIENALCNIMHYVYMSAPDTAIPKSELYDYHNTRWLASKLLTRFNSLVSLHIPVNNIIYIIIHVYYTRKNAQYYMFRQTA